MKTSKIINVLVALIGILAAVAAGAGVLLQGSGTHFDFKTVRGQTVSMQGDGLYKFDSTSIAIQGIAQDFVTLVVGLPLLVISLMLFQKKLLRGKLLLSGTLAYFLYTYTSYSVGSAYNSLFLVYVTLFSLSLFAFILTLMSIDVKTLPLHFTSKLPRKSISTFLFVMASFLVLAWLGRIVPALLDNGVPTGLESSTTLFIQFLDLGVIVPFGFVAGFLLLKKNAWGYLLSSVILFKLLIMGTCVSTMGIVQLVAGFEVSIVELLIFPIITVIGLVMTFMLFKNISEQPLQLEELSYNEVPAVATSDLAETRKELVGRL